MRASWALVLCMGCSLALDVDDLRDRDAAGPVDGGGGDGNRGDAPPPDVLSSDAGPVDVGADTDTGPCELPIPISVVVAGGSLEVGFDRSSNVPHDYALAAGDETFTVMLLVGEDSAVVDYRVRLFQPDFVFTDLNGCQTTLPIDAPPFVEIATRDENTLFPTVRGPSMDIANDGTVAFSAVTLVADNREGVFQWQSDGDPRIVADASAASTIGLTGVRISDDGRALSYWDDGDEEHRVRFGGFDYAIGPATKSVAHDFRCEPCGEPAVYHIVTSELQPGEMTTLRYTMLDGMGELTSMDPGRQGRAPWFSFDNARRRTHLSFAVPNVIPAGAPLLFTFGGGAPPFFDECRLNTDVGIVANDGDQVAFVGECFDQGEEFHLRGNPDTEAQLDSSEFEPIGLLSADSSFEFFLLRVLVGNENRFVILRGPGFESRFLGFDDAGAMGAAPPSGALSQAAISPNGQWAVYPIPDAPNDLTAPFRVARVRIH